jgi:NAD-dependent deacetylase sirtuin 3
MAGAGISTASGIPDFRSPGSGLYNNLHQYNLPFAEAVFDIQYFQQNPQPFFTLAKELYPGNYRPNATHYFVRLLQEKGKLWRMYTQNIDGLERIAGIKPDHLVEAHGTFATATCTTCLKTYTCDDIRDKVLTGVIPKCIHDSCQGVIKPDIVFFGEQLPERFWLHMADMPVADLLIVMGTSLEVEPFASISRLVTWWTPRVLINREIVGEFLYSDRGKDVIQEGDVVNSIKQLIDKVGWTKALEDLTAKCETG